MLRKARVRSKEEFKPRWEDSIQNMGSCVLLLYAVERFAMHGAFIIAVRGGAPPRTFFLDKFVDEKMIPLGAKNAIAEPRDTGYLISV